MQRAIKRMFKLGMFSVLALVALAVSMVVGGNKKYGASSTATGVAFTHADAPGSAGSSGEGGEGGSCGGESGSCSCGSSGSCGSSSGSNGGSSEGTGAGSCEGGSSSSK